MKGGKALTRVLVALVLFGLGAAPARADFDEGRSAYQGGDYGAAFREFKNLAEKGVAEARFVLGSMYKNGQGVRQDQAEAVRWLTLAAKQGVAMGPIQPGPPVSFRPGGRQERKGRAPMAAQGGPAETLLRPTGARVALSQREGN